MEDEEIVANGKEQEQDKLIVKVEKELTDNFLRESVLEPIFQNISNQEDSYELNNLRIKIESDEANENNLLLPINDRTIQAPIEEQPNRNISKQDNSKYFCTICNVGFEEDQFIEHSAIHQNTEFIFCPSCKREFETANMALFYRHYCLNYNKGSSSYICTTCHRTFKTSQALSNHKKIHKEMNDSLYFCHYCEFYFSTAQKRDWHMRNGMHTDKKTKKLKRITCN